MGSTAVQSLRANSSLDSISKNTSHTKMEKRYGSSSRAPALQEQILEFKLQFQKLKKCAKK
jgi:hypothetical protein